MCKACKTNIATMDRNIKQMWVCFAMQKKKQEVLYEHEKQWYFTTEKAKTRYRLCGQQEVFWLYQDQEGSIYKKHIGGNNYYCQDKLCPSCTKRIIHNKRQKVLSFLDKKPELLHKNWYYIVLTVKHTKDDTLSDMWNKLQIAKKTLSNKSRKDKMNIKNWKNQNSFFGSFEGIYWAIETTKTKNWWNVHLNILWCTDDNLELETITTKDKYWKEKITTISRALMNEWKKATKDSMITSCQKLDMSTTQTKEWAIQEVFKYSMKDDSMFASEKVEFAKYTRGKRMMWGWGALQSMLSQKDNFITTDDDMEEILNDELQENDLLQNDSLQENKEYKTSERIDWNRMRYIGTAKYSFWWNWKNVVYRKIHTSILYPGINESDLWLPEEYIFKDGEVFTT